MKKISKGKVRDIYEVDDNSLMIVVSDRISALDFIMPNDIPDKGKILNGISAFWFDYVKDVIPNHVISTNFEEFPEEFRKPEFEGRSMWVKKLKMLPVECIVRGYITGSGWADYKKTGTVCGLPLPEGLQESQKLPEPILLRPQRLSTAIMTRISLLSVAVRFLATNLLKRLRMQQLTSIRSALIMLLKRVLSLPTQSLSLALMRTASLSSLMRS